MAFDKYSLVFHFLLSLLSRNKAKRVRKQECKRIGEDRERNLCLLSECQYTLTCWMMQRDVAEEFYSLGLGCHFPYTHLAAVLLGLQLKMKYITSCLYPFCSRGLDNLKPVRASKSSVQPRHDLSFILRPVSPLRPFVYAVLPTLSMPCISP
jgi:hypothetical protein